MPIDLRIEGAVATIVVNRPDALNALDSEHLAALRDRLASVAEDQRVRALILTGAGERAFIAGADIRAMSSMDVEAARAWGALGQECGILLETMPKPAIAAINGYALGGGCELALACDIRLAATSARLGQPEVSIGVIPGWGGTQRLARATTIGFARELILTGRQVDAQEALERGLVNAVHEPSELLVKARELAEALATKSPLALATAKRIANLALQGTYEEGLAAERDAFAELFGSDDQREGMAAFLEKRPPRFSGR